MEATKIDGGVAAIAALRQKSCGKGEKATKMSGVMYVDSDGGRRDGGSDVWA
jgi:hypothetical protein